MVNTSINITSHHLKPLNTKIKTTNYDVGNQGPGLWQTHKYGGIKPVNAIPTLSSW
jgi:hypothetical protein